MKVLSNVEACVVVGGCVLAVDLLTVVHEASERTSIPLQSNLLAATALWSHLKNGCLLARMVHKLDLLRRMLSEGFGQRKKLTGQPSAGLLEWWSGRDCLISVNFVGH